MPCTCIIPFIRAFFPGTCEFFKTLISHSGANSFSNEPNVALIIPAPIKITSVFCCMLLMIISPSPILAKRVGVYLYLSRKKKTPPRPHLGIYLFCLNCITISYSIIIINRLKYLVLSDNFKLFNVLFAKNLI